MVPTSSSMEDVRSSGNIEEVMVAGLATGARSVILTITWSLSLHFEVGNTPRPAGELWSTSSAGAAISELLGWVRATTTGYKGVEVGTTRAAWSRCFADGRVFCALLHAHDTKLLSYERVARAVEPEARLHLAFSLLRRLGVPWLLDTEPVALEESDLRSIVMYTAKVRAALIAHKQSREAAEKQWRQINLSFRVARVAGAIKARRKQEIDADIASKLARARAATAIATLDTPNNIAANKPVEYSGLT